MATKDQTSENNFWNNSVANPSRCQQRDAPKDELLPDNTPILDKLSECNDDPDDNEMSDDDNINNYGMTASYSEISYQTIYTTTDPNQSLSHLKFDNLDEDSPIKETQDHVQNVENSNQTPTSSKTFKDQQQQPHQRPASLVCDKSFPYNLEGTVSKDGDMMHFVAENLEYKIKLSSPVTKIDLSQPSQSSRTSTPSTSAGYGTAGPSTSAVAAGSNSGIFSGAGALGESSTSSTSAVGYNIAPRQYLFSHQQMPQIDSNVLNDIEMEAQYLAAAVDNLTEVLCSVLHSISSLTADNVELHKNAVNKLTDSMDANIKSMYTIMAKTEEISKSMKPTEQLATRIREIKRLVDMLESNL